MIIKTNGLPGGEQRAAAEAAPPARRRGLPPHIAWPLFVIGLLLLGIAWSLGVVVASRMDGGAQVVENYYEKAIEWDERAALRRQSEALGWTVEIAIEQSQTPLLILTVRDRDGNYVSDLEGIVKAFRPQLTAAVAEMPLTADPEAPGVYRQPLRQAQPGLWDFELTAHRDSNRY